MKTEVIRSWEGFETERDQIRDAARAYYEADKALEIECNESGGDPIGYTIREKNNPGSSGSLTAQSTGQALQKLTELHTHLVSNQKFCFYFVRNEWARILNPSPEEAARCDALMMKLQEEEL